MDSEGEALATDLRTEDQITKSAWTGPDSYDKAWRTPDGGRFAPLRGASQTAEPDRWACGGRNPHANMSLVTESLKADGHEPGALWWGRERPHKWNLGPAGYKLME